MKLLNPLHRAYLMMHIAVVLYGFTAILGKLMDLPGMTIVVYRMGFTFLSLCLIPGVIQAARKLPKKAWRTIAFIGVLMAIHWVTFFEAIHQSNVSLTLSVFASTAFFTSLIEPIFFKHRIRFFEIILAASVIIGFVFIFDFAGERYLVGIVLSLISALVIALSSVINKSVVGQYENVYAITLIEFLAGAAMLLLFFPFYLQWFPETPTIPQGLEWFYLVVLALLCTTLAYTLTMQSLKHVSAYTTSLAMNLEPIYGIVLAMLIFQENRELSLGFYIGTGIILLSVFLHPLLSHFLSKR